MKKKHKRILQLIFLLGILFLLVNWKSIILRLFDRCLTVTILSEAEIGQRTAQKERVDDWMQRPELLLNGQEVAYYAADECYYIPQNLTEGIWDGVLTSSKGKPYWQEDDAFYSFREAVAGGHIFTLACIDEAENKWYHCQVVFTGMSQMVIETEGNEPIDREGAVSTGTMHLRDVQFAGKSYQSAGCRVNVRGDGSRGWPKQGYKLVLDRKLSLLGMRTDEDWILVAMCDDDGLIHNKFSYDVWRDMAADNNVPKDMGTTMEYVELFCNYEYLGVYGLVERMDGKELALEEGDILYKCSRFDPPDETVWPDFGLGIAYDIKYPKEYGREAWVLLKDYLDLFGANEIEDYDSAAALLNMENNIDYNIFTLVASASDNSVRKNICFVADYDERTGGYQFVKVPWDCNATWGLGLYKGNFDRKLYTPEKITRTGPWNWDAKILFRNYPDEIRRLTKERWEELREDILSEERLLGRLDEDFAYLHDSGAYDRNYVRWFEHGREHWKDEYMYEYVTGRLAFLDEYFADPAFVPEE